MNHVASLRKAPEANSEVMLRPSRPCVLTDEAIEAVVEAADSHRERALLALLGATGLRMAEVPRLGVEGLVRRQDRSAMLYVPPGDHHLGRLVLVPRQVAAYVDDYLADSDRLGDDRGPLFLGDEGRALTTAETGLLVLRALSRAGLDARSFVRVDGARLRVTDVFAATFAARFLRAGGTFEGLRRSFGYRDFLQTQKLAAGLAADGVVLPVRA